MANKINQGYGPHINRARRRISGICRVQDITRKVYKKRQRRARARRANERRIQLAGIPGIVSLPTMETVDLASNRLQETRSDADRRGFIPRWWYFFSWLRYYLFNRRDEADRRY